MEAAKLHIDNAQQVLALVLGQKEGLAPELISAYREAGVSHVLALSGLHLAVFCCLFYPIMLYLRNESVHGRATWRSLPAAAVIIACLWWYVFLAGAPMSLIRAAAMYSIGIVAICLRIRLPLWQTLFLSMLLIIAAVPSSLGDVGFQLSCSAILGIATFGTLGRDNTKRSHWSRPIKDLFRVSLACQIFTLPVSLHYFHTLAPLSLPLSIVIVPLVTITLYLSFPLVLLSHFGFSLTPLSWTVDRLLDLQNWIIINSANHIPAIHGIHFSVFLVVLFYLIALLTYYLLWLSTIPRSSHI